MPDSKELIQKILDTIRDPNEVRCIYSDELYTILEHIADVAKSVASKEIQRTLLSPNVYRACVYADNGIHAVCDWAEGVLIHYVPVSKLQGILDWITSKHPITCGSCNKEVPSEDDLDGGECACCRGDCDCCCQECGCSKDDCGCEKDKATPPDAPPSNAGDAAPLPPGTEILGGTINLKE